MRKHIQQYGDITEKGALLFHFVGICGIGMSAIAIVAKAMGHNVQGSDVGTGYMYDHLCGLGIKIYNHHNHNGALNADFVVVSSAISDQNPEVILAKSNNIPVVSRHWMLAFVTKDRPTIGVTGAHGKTTTTTMLAQLFQTNAIDPTVINGGIMNYCNANAYIGRDNLCIIESDESDETFLHVPLRLGVVTNIDLEHVERYGSLQNIIQAFSEFIYDVCDECVVCIDNEHCAALVAQHLKNTSIITYGIDNTDADFVAQNIRYQEKSACFDVVSRHGNMRDICISLPGRHNVLNSLAAIAVGIKFGFSTDNIKASCANFAGVQRRFTILNKHTQALVVDDYAHHPSEIQAAINVAHNIKSIKSYQELIVVFQPHRYSRIYNLKSQFIESFALVDKLYVTPVYSAGEDFIQGCDHLALALQINQKNTVAIDDLSKLIAELKHILDQKVIIMFLGAGDITKYAKALVNEV